MKKAALLSLMIVSLAGAAQAAGDPTLNGSPQALSAYLTDIPGQITLSASSELKVDSDRAQVSIIVRNQDRLLKKALERNQELRESILRTLAAKGIARERIALSRFSSTPAYGLLSKKAKDYDVESRVQISVENEKELQTVAGLIDDTPEFTLSGMSFEDTKADIHAAKAIEKAFDKLDNERQIYEDALGVTLIPRSIGTSQGAVRPLGPARGGRDAESSLLLQCVSAAPLSQSAPASQFDQTVYTRTISVTFDVIPNDSVED